jgi:hypothetical protein
LGHRRFWLAEHHNMPGIVSAATSVAIGYVAGGTSTIRVGAGGIMLPMFEIPERRCGKMPIRNGYLIVDGGALASTDAKSYRLT